MNYQAPPFEAVLFYPLARKEEMLDNTVSLLYAVGHEKLSEGGNHWCLYLAVGDGMSVRIDITPSYSVRGVKIPGGSKAYMPVSLLPCIYSGSARKAVGIQVRTGVKVKDFVNLLLQHNRHQYEFNALGQGCRYWTDDQITLFQRMGLLVNPSQILEAREAILTKYPSLVRYPLVIGSYY